MAEGLAREHAEMTTTAAPAPSQPTRTQHFGVVALALLLRASAVSQTATDITHQFLSLPSVTVSGNIRGVVVGNNGLVYVADSSPALVEINPSSGVRRTILGGLPLAAPNQMLFGDGRPQVGSDLIVADFNTVIGGTCCDGRVLRVDISTGAYSVIATGNPLFSPGDPGGIALGRGGAWGDHLYVMDYAGASAHNPVLYRVSASGQATVFLRDVSQWTTASLPVNIAFDTMGSFGGDLFVADSSGNGVLWRVGANASLAPFAAGFRVYGVASPVSAVWGNFVYCTVNDGSHVDVVRFDVAGRAELVLDNIGAVPYSALAFDPAGRTLVVAAANRIQLVFPAVTQLTSQPDPVGPGQQLTLRNTGGTPGQPLWLLADRLQTVPFDPPTIVTAGSMDPAGTWNQQFFVPPGLQGIDIRVQTLSLDASARFLASNKATARFR